MATHESGEFVSPSGGLRAAARPSLEIALSYWPGRWPRCVVFAAFALESSLEPMTPPEWTDMLDRLAEITARKLADTTTFGEDASGVGAFIPR